MSVSNLYKEARAALFLREVVASGKECTIKVEDKVYWIGYASPLMYSLRRYRSSVYRRIDTADAIDLTVAYMFPDPKSYAYMDTDPAYGHQQKGA